MPVKIRLARQGRKKRPIYHIVAADSRSPRDGKFIERLGLYNQERQFSLQHSKSKSDGIAPVKECGCIHGKKVKYCSSYISFVIFPWFKLSVNAFTIFID